VVVNLTSSSAAFPVPATVTIAAGEKGASVKVQTTAVSAYTAVTVTATYNGVSKTAGVTLSPAAPPK
jgi:hypothetical protein